jgi:hypothetical protein
MALNFRISMCGEAVHLELAEATENDVDLVVAIRQTACRDACWDSLEYTI